MERPFTSPGQDRPPGFVDEAIDASADTPSVTASDWENPALTPLPLGQTLPFWRRNPLTTAFALLLIAVYGWSSQGSGFQAISIPAAEWGAFYPPAVHAGEWWRFVTANLLHANPGHLFNNVLGILVFGNLLEPVIGSARLGGLYAFSGLAGMALVGWLQRGGLTLGASAIDYGLIGCYLTLVLLLRFRQERRAFYRELRGMLTFVAIFVLWNWTESGAVSLWGHVGGLMGGVIYAGLLWIGGPARRSTAR